MISREALLGKVYEKFQNEALMGPKENIIIDVTVLESMVI